MDKKEEISMNWLMKLTHHLCKENFKIIDAQTVAKGQDAADMLVVNFLAQFIGNILHRRLNERPNNLHDKEELIQYTQNNFADMKLKLQNAVASGFENAMMNYTGKPVEYYCHVTPVGPAVNKLPL